MRGDGRFENGVEYPRAAVTLATQLPPEDCRQLALGYQNPNEIDMPAWQNREGEGILLVPKAGEMLYSGRSQIQDEQRQHEQACYFDNGRFPKV